MMRFVIVTKWSKINNTGPGYIHYHILSDIVQLLSQGMPTDEILKIYDIPAENFNQEIYETYLLHIQHIQKFPESFEIVLPNSLGVCYSIGIYDGEFTDSRSSEPRTAFLDLIGVNGDKVTGYYDMSGYTGGFDQLEELYNNIKNL